MNIKPTVAITGTCLATWSIGAFLVVPDAKIELTLGMILPFLLTIGSTILFERTFTRNPSQLTPLMIKAFGAKMIIVGTYVVIIVGLTHLDPIVFIASFSTYFIGLHLTEALQLRSLFS